ncbi:MAG: ABC transporter ATP-binding protein [Proteobacteria bacterium]|nr:ABC transporter ATP-binding protein [Pseudomonadota bacterium]
MAAYIDLIGIRKSYGASPVAAVDGVDLSIQKGEFVTLLGSSGCGKTTTLRCIAGFEMPDTGTIRFSGEDITYSQPSERDMRMVFQDFALFPNMTISENVAFGLRLKKMRGRYSEAQIRARVEEYLSLVQLADHGKKMPHQLSGGQKQRTALARALITDPAVVLFDEPLASLDANLRKAMQVEIKRLHRQFNKTFIYVTHDQEEAMAMSDRIVVMNKGRIVQSGSPEEVYSQPNSKFVANFIDRANILTGIVETVDGSTAKIRLASGATLSAPTNDATISGKTVGVMIRVDRVSLGEDGSDQRNILRGIVAERLFLGAKNEYVIELADGAGRISVHERTAGAQASIGDVVPLCVLPDDIRVLAA